MVGLGKSISHTKASMEYGWNQEKDSKIVYRQNLIGENPTEITREFKMIQSQNGNCTVNTLSFVLSPTIKDGKKLDIDDLTKITDEFIKDLNLGDRQAIGFSHNDKDHKHIHLYINRISFKGKAYNDSFIGKKAQKAAERVAIKLGLQTIKQIQDQKLENTKSIRNEIKEKHNHCLSIIKPSGFQDYIDEMNKLHIEAIPVINKSNQLQGFRYKYKNINLKATEIEREMSINKFSKYFTSKPNFLSLYKSNNGIFIDSKVIQLPTLIIKEISPNNKNNKL